MTKRKAKTKKNKYRRKVKSRLQRVLGGVKKAGLMLSFALFVLWAGTWLWMSGTFQKTSEWASASMIQASADAGFVVQDILVEGRVHTDSDLIMALLNVEKGDPLLGFNPSQAQELMARISWIDEISIARRFPNVISVNIVEKIPAAIWSDGSKTVLVDESGSVITDKNLARFSNLLQISGENAPQHLSGLVEYLNAQKDLSKRVKMARWVGDRRWDIVFENKITARLPADDVALALSMLARADAKDGLLSRDIQSIDLRETGRVIVKTRPGALQEYKEQEYKAQEYQANYQKERGV